MREALLYHKLAEQGVSCYLCAHLCTIAAGQAGVCQVRENRDGTLYSLVYGQAGPPQVDLVEKSPLFHFHPGSKTYSLATPGCNFRCSWCPTAGLSPRPGAHAFPGGEEARPEQVVARARQAGCHSITYTYGEPTVDFEFTYDTARLAHEAGLANIYMTNGYMTPEMLEQLSPYLDAANVGLQSFRDETYRQHMGARLQPVLDSIATIKRQGAWLEISTLVVPNVNDDPADLRETARFVAQLGVETPWHVTRFVPAYRMRTPGETPLSILEKARDIGKEEGLRYIYIGNVPTRGSLDTLCPVCSRTLIVRRGFAMIANDLHSEACPDCGTAVAGVNL